MKKTMFFVAAVLALSVLSVQVKADENIETQPSSNVSFRSVVSPEFGYGAVHNVTYIGNGVTCWQVGRRNMAQCSADPAVVAAYTGRVIANGWVNYGPWAPRPGIGVIIP